MSVSLCIDAIKRDCLLFCSHIYTREIVVAVCGVIVECKWSIQVQVQLRCGFGSGIWVHGRVHVGFVFIFKVSFQLG